MKRFFTLAITGAMLMAGSAVAASINPYTDQSAFALATGTLGLTATETFNNATSSIFNISFSGAGTQRGIDTGTGKLYDQLLDGAGNSPLQTTTISLVGGAPLYGLAGMWDLSFLGAGGGVTFTLNLVGGGTFNLAQILGTSALPTLGNTGNSTGQFFFGFVTDSAIASITLGANTIGSPENYTLDNLQATTLAAPIPEPATFGMMGLALVGLGLVRRGRR